MTMTTPRPPHAPLDDAERALAARLARLGPHGAPDAALDARILAAAAEALARDEAHARPARTRRWPWLLGIAASLVLAIGLAWRLRPPPAPSGTPLPVHPPRAQTIAAPDADASHTPAGEAAARSSATPRPARNTAAAGAVPATPSALTPPPAPPMASPSPQATTPEAAVQAMPTPADAFPAPPPPPPPPAAERGAPAVKALAAPAPPAPAALAREAAGNTDAQDATAGDDTQGLPGSRDAGDEPPATADQPAVQAAWLARIRHLRETGHAAAARDSLAEFRRRYPDVSLPADLDAWWRETPPPTP
jgi:hypothetical protein